MSTLFLGRELLKFDELDSTNSYLKEICRKTQANEGVTVVAKYQTSGRGQIGNTWEAEKGKNLLFSLLLRPVFLNISDQFLLNMSVCLAVADTLNEIVPGFEIKWPNDILYHRKKVCGILIENSIQNKVIEQSVVGIGLNVNQLEFKDKKSRCSVKSVTGYDMDPDFLMRKILSRLEARYLKLKNGNTQSIYEEYHTSLYGMNREIAAEIEGRKTMIKIAGVESSGKLIACESENKMSFGFKEIKFLLQSD